jgi:ferritin
MKLTSQISALLTDHITLERLAEVAYRSVSNWADERAFQGLKKWADGEAKEEIEHQEMVLEYLRDRGLATMQAVPVPQTVFGDYVATLQYLLSIEERVSDSLNAIMAAAAGAKDYSTQQALWSLLPVQVKSEKTLRDAIQRVQRGAPIDLIDSEIWEPQHMG